MRLPAGNAAVSTTCCVARCASTCWLFDYVRGAVRHLSIRDYWPHLPAPSWIELHVDAGSYRETYRGRIAMEH
jgi:hypothetical protein